MKKKYLNTVLTGTGTLLELHKNAPLSIGKAFKQFQSHFIAIALLILTTTAGFAQATAYCIPAPQAVSGTGITNVHIGTINNTTAAEEGNYANYSSQIVSAGQNVAVPFSITFTIVSSYGVKIWVDWNDDFDFDDGGENVYSSSASNGTTQTLTGVFSVPGNTTLGNHRLRIGGVVQGRGTPPATPCYTGSNGSFEDYTINVTVPPTCFVPVNLTTANVASGIINIGWAAPSFGNIPVGYEYAVTTSATPPATGTAATGTTVAGVTAPVNGYLHVRSNCGNGDYSEWVSTSFYNGVCIPAPQGVDGNGITNVTIGSINNTTGLEAGNYGDFTAQVANIGQGVTQQFSITLATNMSFYTKIWVDWNDDLDFDDEGEEIYSGTSDNAPIATVNGNFTVPVSATLGNHRLRVGVSITWGSTVTPCFNSYNAAFEDYTINVTTPPSCFSPINPVGISTASGFANISWTAPVLGNTPVGYEYAVTSSITPPASGTASTTTSVTGIAVAPNAVSYIHVRSNCGNGDYSTWFTAPYYNGYCVPAPASIEGTGITNVTIATINNSTTEASGYEDHTAQAAIIGQGVTQSFSISLNTFAAYNVKIWVDWNDNLSFDDEGEEVYSGTSASGDTVTLRGNFTVPTTAVIGNHRLRIGAVSVFQSLPTPCYTADYGVFEDYTLTVTTPPSCFTPNNFTAQITGSGINSLSWTAPLHGTTSTGYQYAVTATATPPASGTDVTGTSAANVSVAPNAISYLHVRTNCGAGDFSEWITIPFYNGYCVPQPAYVNGQGITNVTIGSINNTTQSEETFYGDYSAQIVNIGQGVTQPFSVGLQVYVPFNVVIWVDWNNDLDFDDEGERIYTGVSANGEFATVSGTFVVPVAATLGNHRLRIGINAADSALPTTCGTRTNSTYEDYTINVTNPPSCFTPTNAIGVATASGNANLSWTAPTLGNTPVGYEYAVITSATPPQSGTQVTDNFVNGYSGFADNTYYYLHVRTNCGNGDFSEWITSARFRYLQGDTCDNAFNLATLISPYTSTTQGAADNFASECTQINTAPDLYFYIEVPNGYTISIGQTDNDYDSINYVGYGSTCPGQTQLACYDEDDYTTTIWENLTGRTQTVYFIQDGFASQSGAFTLQWELTPPAACDVPRNPDVFLTSLTSTNISWTAPNTGTPTGYEYAITTSAMPPASGTSTTQLSANNIAITANVNNYLHIRSVCGEAGNSIWVTYQFFAGYCVPENTNSTAYYISGVSTTGGTTNISNLRTGFNGYSDYTAQAVSTYAGGTFSLTATHPSETYLYSVWIDWNQNFDFTDQGENIFSTGYLPSPSQLGNIVVPIGTPQGNYRIRIRNANTGGSILSCGDQGYGETEDYTLTVIATPTCFPPYGLAIEPVDATTANLRWSPPELGSQPQGYEYVLSTTPTVPTGSGTPTTSIFIDSAPYNPAVSTYLFVRSTCGDGEYSEWINTEILDSETPQLLEKSVMVFKEGNAINVTSGTALIKGLTIYDVRGSKLYTQANINNNTVAITGLQIQQQVVIVEIVTSKGKVSKRIVF